MSIGTSLIVSTLTGLLGSTAVYYYLKYRGDLNQPENEGAIFLSGITIFITAGTALTLNSGISALID